MQSQKKFRKPKRLTTSAQEFARPWAQNIGSYKKAVLTADNYEFASREEAKRTDITKAEAREAIRTANFWNNVGGILRQFQTKMGEKPEVKKTDEERRKGVKENTPNRRPKGAEQDTQRQAGQ